jgi:hypothetical protein
MNEPIVEVAGRNGGSRLVAAPLFGLLGMVLAVPVLAATVDPSLPTQDRSWRTQ